MPFTPIDDRVVIKRVQAAEQTAGGVVMPDCAKERPYRGEVVAAGPGRMMDNGQRGAMMVKTGDEVIYMKYAGDAIEICGEEYVVLRENDILVKINK